MTAEKQNKMTKEDFDKVLKKILEVPPPKEKPKEKKNKK